MSTPFSAATARLADVVGPGAEVAAPRADDGAGIDVTLVRLSAGACIRHLDRRRQPVELHHLVSVAGPAAGADDLLYRAWAAVLASGDLDVVGEQVPMDWWVAYGVAPRPAFVVRSTVVLDEPLERAAPAERLAVVHHAEADTEAARTWEATRR